MRIQRTEFGIRKKVLTSDKPLKKYFLAYEGVKTEVQYFNGICDNKNYLKLSPSIELIPLLRNHINIGLSHPKKVFEIVQKCLNDLNINARNIKSLINAIVDYCFEKSDKLTTKEDSNDLHDSILAIFTERYGLTENDIINFNDEEMVNILEIIMEVISAKIICVENIEGFILAQFESFDSDYDEVCLIIDRDKKSFFENQYDQLLQQCKLNNYKLYVTNPCFEFWLLLHFSQVFDLDEKELEENKKYKIDSKSEDEELNYTELKLRGIIPEFRKHNVCFDKFKDKLSTAILNSKSFETDLVELKKHIGTNIGDLFEELQDSSEE